MRLGILCNEIYQYCAKKKKLYIIINSSQFFFYFDLNLLIVYTYTQWVVLRIVSCEFSHFFCQSIGCCNVQGSQLAFKMEAVLQCAPAMNIKYPAD